MALTPGTRFGVYDVTAPLGEGGMGQVFRARDTKLNREVALKVLRETVANDADRLARFTRLSLADVRMSCTARPFASMPLHLPPRSTARTATASRASGMRCAEFFHLGNESAVAKHQGRDGAAYERALHEVWGTMYNLQT